MGFIRRVPLDVWLWALGLACLTSLPYVIAYLSVPAGGDYTGALVQPFGVAVDYNSHMAKLWQGQSGQWAYQLLFTAEAHRGLPLVQGFYVLLGALSPLDIRLSFHLARFGLCIGVVLALWALIRRATADLPAEQAPQMRRLGLFMGTLMTGWGWVLWLLAPQLSREIAPIEVWLSDAYSFLGVLLMPHFSAAIILQIVGVLALDKALGRAVSRREIGLHSLLWGVLMLIQPYAVLLFAPLLLLMGWRLWHTQGLMPLWLLAPVATMGLVSGGQVLMMQGDAVWQSFSAQNITASPPPIYYILGYAPFILPILGSGRALWRRMHQQSLWWALAAWIVLVLVLVYAPVQTQRRYLLGVQTPLAILSAYAWLTLQMRFPRPLKLAFLPYAAAGLIAPLFILIGNSLSLSRAEDASVFISADEQTAYAWVRASTPATALFLTTFDPQAQGNGGKLVAMTGRRVTLGHWIETADFIHKYQQVQAFYGQMNAEEQTAFLRAAQVNYVWYDASVQALGELRSPALKAVYMTPSLLIYEVLP